MSNVLLSRTQVEMERCADRPGELSQLAECIARIQSDIPEESKKKPKPKPTKENAGEPTTRSLGPAEEAIPTGKTKVCTKCKLPKPLDRFPPHPDTADGLAAWCKDCRAVLRKRRNQNNMGARLKHHFAARMTQQLVDAGVKKVPPLVAEMESYLGYKMIDLVRHLDGDIQEREGMTLKEAFDKGYHVDHITPLSKFPLTAIGDETFRQCWAIDNLRAIPATDNLKKGAVDIFEGDE